MLFSQEYIGSSQSANCLISSIVLQTSIALAASDADNASPDGYANLVEVLPDHFQRVIERKRVFINDTNAIRNMSIEERALNEGLRRDRNLKLQF